MQTEIPASVLRNAMAAVIRSHREASPHAEERDLLFGLYRAGFSSRELTEHFDAAVAVANSELKQERPQST